MTILVVTTLKSATDPALVRRLMANDIHKMILMEVPVELVRERYGEHFERIVQILGREEFRVVDFNGSSVFNKFTFAEMGAPLQVEF
jgi:phenylacetate-coenzyme A ligase PaaK-like adenylate-forming protein